MGRGGTRPYRMTGPAFSDFTNVPGHGMISGG